MANRGSVPAFVGIEGDVRKGVNTARRFSETPGADIFNAPKLQAMLSGQRAAIMRPDYVLPSGPGANLFGSLLASAQAPVGPTDAPIAGSFPASDQLQNNTPVPIIRTYYVSPPRKGQTASPSEFDLPSVYGLAIIKRPSGTHGKAVRVHTDVAIGGGSSFKPMPRKGQLVSDEPLLAYNPEAWNKYIVQELYTLFKSDPVAYRKLTPADIWFGHKDYAWTGWAWDGVVTTETMGGRSSKFSNDFSQNTRLGRGVYSGSASLSKFVTTIAQGEIDILDYTNGRGLQEGATLHFVLTKVRLGGEGGLSQDYLTSSKATPLALPAPGVAERLSFATMEELQGVIRARITDARAQANFVLTEPFKPFQLVPIMVASGSGFVEPELTQSTDEWGVQHFYGADFNIGRVLFAPYVYQQRAAVTETKSAFFAPATNGYQTMLNERYTIVLNATMNGLFSIL